MLNALVYQMCQKQMVEWVNNYLPMHTLIPPKISNDDILQWSLYGSSPCSLSIFPENQRQSWQAVSGKSSGIITGLVRGGLIITIITIITHTVTRTNDMQASIGPGFLGLLVHCMQCLNILINYYDKKWSFSPHALAC